LTWHFDQEAIDAEAAVDGWYALLTNLPADQATPAQVLLHYKGQGTVERRYSHVEGPFAIAPMFLQSNRRIAALITVICLALLVYCLIERQVRQALGDQRTMRGLHPGSNQAARPTGELILTALSDLQMRSGTATSPPVVLVSEGIQAQLLDILDVDPPAPAGSTHDSPCAKDTASRAEPVARFHRVVADPELAPQQRELLAAEVAVAVQIEQLEDARHIHGLPIPGLDEPGCSSGEIRPSPLASTASKTVSAVAVTSAAMAGSLSTSESSSPRSTAPSPLASPASSSAAHQPISSVSTRARNSVPGPTPGSRLQRATSALKSSSRR
jgi:hypothetical protein